MGKKWDEAFGEAPRSSLTEIGIIHSPDIAHRRMAIADMQRIPVRDKSLGYTVAG
jgi:hypothetical protein